MVSWVGMNSDCLVSLLTTTKIAVNPSDVGNCSMKSMEMESHSWFGMGSCFRRLYGLWQGVLDLVQLVHDLTKPITVCRSPGQWKPQQMRSVVFASLKCLVVG